MIDFEDAEQLVEHLVERRTREVVIKAKTADIRYNSVPFRLRDAADGKTIEI